MAKYVEYTPDVFAVQDGSVHIWWFPTSFCQSQLGDRVIGSNACTLITVLLAGRLHEFGILIWGYIDQPLSRMLVTSLAEAIVEGNDIHENLCKRGELFDVDMTVPEAIRAVRFKYPSLTEWIEKTVLETRAIGESLTQNIRKPITEFEHNPPADKRANSDLFIILVADTRSVLFCYQSKTSKITMMDSHCHLACNSGAVVAQVRFSDLNQLCNWYCAMCTQVFENGTTIAPYELAFLYIRN